MSEEATCLYCDNVAEYRAKMNGIFGIVLCGKCVALTDRQRDALYRKKYQIA